MSSSTDFLSLVARGQASLDQIDDYIDEWHDGSSTQELHEFLGMTAEDYASWLKRPAALIELSRARQARAPHDPQPHGAGTAFADPSKRGGGWHQARQLLGSHKGRYRGTRRDRPADPAQLKPFSRHAQAMHQRHDRIGSN